MANDPSTDAWSLSNSSKWEPNPAPLATPRRATKAARPARLWEWTGFWAFLLVTLEQLQAALGGWTDAPWWVPMVLAGLPILIRWLRSRVSGRPTSYRAIRPPK